MRMRLPIVLVAALACPAAGATGAAGAKALTDADLLNYAHAPFDKRAMMFKRVALGRHRGLPVVADHPCGDVCPVYTRRIVHYDVPLADCARRGGVVRDELVPSGPAVVRRPYCTPAVLAAPPAKPR